MLSGYGSVFDCVVRDYWTAPSVLRSAITFAQRCDLVPLEVKKCALCALIWRNTLPVAKAQPL